MLFDVLLINSLIGSPFGEPLKKKSEITLPSEPFQNLQLSPKKVFSKTHESKNRFFSASKADNELKLKF